MCSNNTCLWTVILIYIFFNCKRGLTSTPLNFSNFFELDSSDPLGQFKKGGNINDG